ncbi:MAG TPA: carboxypeptidase regulatory-like domain-containing protein [Terriglobales bacterium]|nr:carboxypeptidase regulatory-like domain-containing protein [Terriglobales bacterium]
MNADFRRKVAVALSCLLLIFCSTYALGQGVVTGSISGTVVDPQGAVIVGAKVTATNTATNQSANDSTSSAGAFSIRQLPPGSYTVSISAPNFQTLSVKGVNVSVGVDTAMGAQRLVVGATSETVTVEATAPLVETSTPQLSTTYENKQITDLPIGSAFDSLVLLIPGAASTGDASFSNNNGAVGGGISMNGQRGRSNNFQIDGQNNNDNSVAGPAFFLSNQDVLAEYQVVTNTFSAEYGRNMGSVINYITKSGSNALHGTAFWFYQGSWLSSMANQDKSPLLGFCIPPATSASTGGACTDPKVARFDDSRVGGTIGGPIKKNKAWFFGSYQREWLRQGATPSTSAQLTPTPAGLAALAAAFPGNLGVLNLETFGPYGLLAGNPSPAGASTPICVTPDLSGATACVPIEFAKVTRFLPNTFNQNELMGRIDVQVTQKDRFFGRYLYQDNNTSNAGPGQLSSVAGGGVVGAPNRNQQIGLDWVRTFTDHFINQVRFSYARFFGFFEAGPTMPFCTATNILLCPSNISFTAGNLLNYGQAINLPQGRLINNSQWQDNASWVHGRHTIKFGGEYDRQRSPNVFLPNINGRFQFGAQGTCNYNGGLASTAACTFDNYLANLPSALNLTDGPTSFNFKEQDAALYIQDDWRFRDNLTLNFGLRWEWNQQAINLLHDLTVRRETGPAPFWDTTLPLALRTVPSVPEDLNNFGPVIGFAYTPHIWPGVFGKDKTVIRGGFRIAYDPEFYNMFLNVATAAPTVNAGSIAGWGLTPGLPPGGVSTGLSLRAAGYLGFIPTGVDPGFRTETQVDPNFHNPYAMQWNFGIQRELNSKIALEVNYVGNHTVGNFMTINANPEVLLLGAFFPGVIPPGVTPCTTPLTPGFPDRPDCNFRLERRRGNYAFSEYHGLETNLRIQNWHGLTSGFAWTWSHGIDNVSEIFPSFGGGVGLPFAQDPFNIDRAERGTSGTSYTHVIAFWWVYELPWYKSQAGFLGKALGGWQINGIYSYHSGQPFNPLDFATNDFCDFLMNASFYGVDTCRPILGDPTAPLDTVGQYVSFPGCTLSSFYPDGATSFHWIYNDDTAALCQGTPFAGVGRNTLRGDTYNNLDLGIYKNFKMGERLTMQIQANGFNILNRQFRNIGVESGTVGGANPDPFVDDGNFASGGPFMNTFFNGSNKRNFTFGLRFVF